MYLINENHALKLRSFCGKISKYQSGSQDTHVALITTYLSELNNHNAFEKELEIQGYSEPKRVISSPRMCLLSNQGGTCGAFGCEGSLTFLSTTDTLIAAHHIGTCY